MPKPMDPISLRVLAQDREEANWHFRHFLKHQCRISDEKLEFMVHELTEQVSANIDCTLCANCCKTIRPTLTDQDVDRLATRLAISRQELIDKYLDKNVRDPDSPWITRTTPCPFLQDNLCSVYHDRPEACQGYPYLDEPDLRFRMIDMVRGTFTCPIIYEVMEKLKAMTRFRHR